MIDSDFTLADVKVGRSFFWRPFEGKPIWSVMKLTRAWNELGKREGFYVGLIDLVFEVKKRSVGKGQGGRVHGSQNGIRSVEKG